MKRLLGKDNVNNIQSLQGSFPQFSPIVEKLGKPSRGNLQNYIIQWTKV